MDRPLTPLPWPHDSHHEGLVPPQADDEGYIHELLGAQDAIGKATLLRGGQTGTCPEWTVIGVLQEAAVREDADHDDAIAQGPTPDICQPGVNAEFSGIP
jgi:hypothetical protein